MLQDIIYLDSIVFIILTVFTWFNIDCTWPTEFLVTVLLRYYIRKNCLQLAKRIQKLEFSYFTWLTDKILVLTFFPDGSLDKLVWYPALEVTNFMKEPSGFNSQLSNS